MLNPARRATAGSVDKTDSERKSSCPRAGVRTFPRAEMLRRFDLLVHSRCDRTLQSTKLMVRRRRDMRSCWPIMSAFPESVTLVDRGVARSYRVTPASRPNRLLPAPPGRLRNAWLLTTYRIYCMNRIALLIEGRLRRRSRWRSKVWRPAAAARNRGLGRHGLRPPGNTTRAARSVAVRTAEGMPQTEARNREPKTATVERREASALGAPQARQGRVAPRKRDNSMRLSALRRPLGMGSDAAKVHTRTQSRRGNEGCCLKGVCEN